VIYEALSIFIPTLGPAARRAGNGIAGFPNILADKLLRFKNRGIFSPALFASS
jgi:hypothetical protein